MSAALARILAAWARHRDMVERRELRERIDLIETKWAGRTAADRRTIRILEGEIRDLYRRALRAEAFIQHAGVSDAFGLPVPEQRTGAGT